MDREFPGQLGGGAALDRPAWPPRVSAWMAADDVMVTRSWTIGEIVSALGGWSADQALDELAAGPAEVRADELANVTHAVADIEL